MVEPHCYKRDCKNYWSCKYLKHRFKTEECYPYKKVLVDSIYEEELKEREEMLKKFNNYGRDM